MKLSKCCREEVNTIRGVCGGFTNYCKRCGKLCDTIEQPMQNTPTPMQKDKQYSDLTQEEKDNLHSNCCEGTNEAQSEIIKAYERGFIEGANLTGSQAKEELEEQKIEILEKYNKFLIKNNYADDDLWNEKPTAIERFLEEK